MSEWNLSGRGAAVRPPTKLLTVKQTAERLSVCTRTVRRLITNDELKTHRIGGSLRISEEDLRAYLARCR